MKELNELKTKLGRFNVKSVQDDIVAQLDQTHKRAQETFRNEVEMFERDLAAPQDLLLKVLEEATDVF